MKKSKWAIPVVLAVFIILVVNTQTASAHSCCEAKIAQIDQWFDDVEITIYIPETDPGVFGSYSLIRFDRDEDDGVYIFKNRIFEAHEAREGERGYHYFDVWDKNVDPDNVTYVLESECGTCDADSFDVEGFAAGCGTVSAGAIDSLIPALILVVLLILSLGSWKQR